MGPLFSIAVVARVFHPPLIAFAAAFAFVLGGGVGTTLFGLASWLFVGPTTLNSHWQVFGYLAMLVSSAIFGGLCLELLFLRLARRSNSSFEADGYAAA
jgi:hypothetical protein